MLRNENRVVLALYNLAPNHLAAPYLDTPNWIHYIYGPPDFFWLPFFSLCWPYSSDSISPIHSSSSNTELTSIILPSMISDTELLFLLSIWVWCIYLSSYHTISQMHVYVYHCLPLLHSMGKHANFYSPSFSYHLVQHWMAPNVNLTNVCRRKDGLLLFFINLKKFSSSSL